MERILNVEKVDLYFQSLAEKHNDLKDYCGTSRNELANKITSKAGIKSPILILYDINSKLSGNEQRTNNTRAISFAVAYTGVKANDFVAEKLAVKNAEAIVLEILSRINVESKMPEIGWLYTNFIKDSVTYNEFEVEEVAGLFGIDCTFELKVQEQLVVDKTKWSDGDTFC